MPTWTNSLPDYVFGLELTPGSYHNLTPWVEQFSITRDLFTALYQGGVGQASVVLDNHDGIFSPTNSAGPYYGVLGPQVRARLQATYGGSTYNLFQGYVHEFTVTPELGDRKATLDMYDEMRVLRDATITSSLRLAINVGSVFTELLSASGIGSWSVAPLAETLAYSWFDNHDALQALRDLAASGGYFAFVDGAGTVQVKNRYYELMTSVVGSYTDLYGMTYSYGQDDVFNLVTVQGAQYQPGTPVSTVAFLVDGATIGADDSVSFWLNYKDPDTNEDALATDLIVPVASTDYTTNTNSDGSGDDYTSSMSLTVQFFGRSVFTRLYNPGPDAVWITKYVVRGTPLLATSQLRVTVPDSASQVLYGVQKLNVENRFLTDRGFISDYATFLARRSSLPAPRVGIALRNEFPVALALDPGATVHVINSNTGVQSLFTVVGIDHAVDATAGIHDVRLRLDGIRAGQDVLILDHTDFGKLDQRVYGF